MRTLTIACFALCLSACGTLPAPRPLSADAEIVARYQEKKLEDYRVLLAPIQSTYNTLEFGGEAKISETGSASHYPGLTPDDKARIAQRLEETLDLVFPDRVDIMAGAAGGEQERSLEELCKDAERRGANLLLTTEVTENRLSYKGTNGLYVFDVATLIIIPPLHWWIPDEVFEQSQKAKFKLYDVRDWREPIHSFEVEAGFVLDCDEFEHGVILFNPVLDWFMDFERFDVDSWKQLDKTMLPHTELAFQKAFLGQLDLSVRSVLQSPDVRRRLREGAPGQARLYAVVVGQDGGETNFAEADAKEFFRVLKDRSGILPSYSWLKTGKVKPDEILALIRSIRSKSVDRIIFYFAGQGRQSRNGEQELVFTNGERLSIQRLAEAFKPMAAENVAFFLDCSFGDPKRGVGVGGRSVSDSYSKLSGNQVRNYLGALRSKVGWRVLCAATHDAVTGEYRGHGLLTGLCLGVIQREKKSGLSINTICARIDRRFTALNQSRLGLPYELYYEAGGQTREFPLILAKTEGSKMD